MHACMQVLEREQALAAHEQQLRLTREGAGAHVQSLEAKLAACKEQVWLPRPHKQACTLRLRHAVRMISLCRENTLLGFEWPWSL